MRKIELLSPCGCRESVFAAVYAGCNAIYLGGKNFGARARAENFESEEIKEVIDYCHLRGVKVYITINTLYNNSEINSVLEFMNEMYAYGADAFIMQDIGVFSLAKKHFPGIDFHASTQISASNVRDVEFLQSIGFKRVVLSRELNLDEIKKIKLETNANLEVFVHGALCYSFSGRCYMSNYFGGRSGNRGECAQPCRQQYSLVSGNAIQNNYVLSTKDIMTIDMIDEMAETGIDSFKIEGRMKNPEYVGVVTRAYREKMDSIIDIEKRKNELTQVFSRGGFSKGFLSVYSNKNMMSCTSPKPLGLLCGEVLEYKKPNTKILFYKDCIGGDGLVIETENQPYPGFGINKQISNGETVVFETLGEIKPGDKVYKSFDKALSNEMSSLIQREQNNYLRKLTVSGKIKAVVGQPIALSLFHDNSTVEIIGDIVNKAKTKPVTQEKIIEQLGKTGQTPLKIDFVSCEISDDCFISLSELNDIRRKAVEELCENITEKHEKKLVKLESYKYISSKNLKKSVFSAYVSNAEQLLALKDYSHMLKRIYVNFDYDKQEFIDVEIYRVLPDVERISIELGLGKYDGYLIKNIGQYNQLKNSGKKLVLDSCFNIMNRASFDFYDMADSVTLSSELKFIETDFNEFTNGISTSEYIIYGRQRLMTTVLCPIGMYAADKDKQMFCGLKNKEKDYHLVDRTGAELPIMTDCQNCIAYIYSDKPVSLMTKRNIMVSGLQVLRIDFTTESSYEVDEIMQQIINLK